jgi:hypothetical protein
MIGSRARFLSSGSTATSRSSSTTSAPSLGTFSSMRRLPSLTASSERRSRMPEDGTTRQCAAAHGVGASRNRRMRIDRPGYSIHSRHSMDQSIILSLSSTRDTVTLRRHADSATSRPHAAADQRSWALRRRAVRGGPDTTANARRHPLSATRRGDRAPACAPSGGCSTQASSRCRWVVITAPRGRPASGAYDRCHHRDEHDVGPSFSEPPVGIVDRNEMLAGRSHSRLEGLASSRPAEALPVPGRLRHSDERPEPEDRIAARGRDGAQAPAYVRLDPLRPRRGSGIRHGAARPNLRPLAREARSTG